MAGLCPDRLEVRARAWFQRSIACRRSATRASRSQRRFFAARLRARLRRLLRLVDFLPAVALELGLDVVADPLRVPPFDRQDRDAVEVHAVVQVVAAGEAGLAGLADDLLAAIASPTFTSIELRWP
jgi:hypothetical protein